MNFDSVFDSDQYHNTFQMKEKETNILYFKDIELHMIELTKFTKNLCHELNDLVARVQNALDRWLAFLTNHDLLNKDQLSPSLDDPSLKKALGVMDIMNLNPEEYQAYEDRLKWLRDEASILQKKEDDGFAKGKQRAGKKVERKAGKIETTLDIARKMIQAGMPTHDVAQFTGLSLERLKDEGLITG